MAINPAAYNPNFNQTLNDRGAAPAPGDLSQDDPRTRYVRVWTPDGWQYLAADSGMAQSILAHAQGSPNIQVVTIPGWTDGNGQIRKDDVTPSGTPDWTPVSPAEKQAQAASVPNGYDHQEGPAVTPTTPAAEPAASTAASATPAATPAAGPTSAPGQPGQNNYRPTGFTDPSDPKSQAYINGTTTDGSTPAKGPWVRVTPYDAVHGDMIGYDIVRADSQTGTAATKAGQSLHQIDDQWYDPTSGNQLPIDLVASDQFENVAKKSTEVAGGKKPTLVSFGTDNSIQNDNPEGRPRYTVTWIRGDGLKENYVFESANPRPGPDPDGQAHTYVRLMKSDYDPATWNSPQKQALETAQANEANARTALATAQASQIPGAIESTDLKNKREAWENAEREVNLAAGKGRYTNDELITQGHTAATTANVNAQTTNLGAQTAATEQGSINQTRANVLQYYRDLTGDEAKATELTEAYFRDRSNTDVANNRLAFDAANAQVNAETAANTQRVSLANNRLTQASQGFSDDAKATEDLNQYLKPGSSRGGDILDGRMAMRYATAKKYGAFDVNDADVKFDPTKLPNGIRAFANPAHPSFATYPDFNSMRDEAHNTADRWGVYNRPGPSENPTVVKAPAAPTPQPVPPAYSGKPATIAASPAAAASPASGQPASQVSPDDIIIAQDDQGNGVVMTRRRWDAEDHSNLQVVRADNGAVWKQAHPGEGFADIDPATGKKWIDHVPAQTGVTGDIPPGGSSVTPAQAAPVAPTYTYTDPSSGGVYRYTPDGKITVFGSDGQSSAIGTWDPSQGQPPGTSKVDTGSSGDRIPTSLSGSPYPPSDPNGPMSVHPDAPSAASPSNPYGDPNPGGPTPRIIPQPTDPSMPVNVPYPSNADPESAYPSVPNAIAGLNSPPNMVAYTNQMLSDPDEIQRRRRMQGLTSTFGSPLAMSDIFDGSYPRYPSFFG